MTDTPEQATLRASIRNRMRQAGWWAPTRLPSGQPTHPGAPHRAWIRLCAHQDPQDYGDPADLSKPPSESPDHSLPMHVWSVQQYGELGVDAANVRPTFQAYRKRIADTVQCATAVDECQFWDALEMDDACRTGLRIVRALAIFGGFTGPLAVAQFETLAKARGAYGDRVENRAGAGVIAAIATLYGVDVTKPVAWDHHPLDPAVAKPWTKIGMYWWPNRGAARMDIPAAIAEARELGVDHVIAQAGMDSEHWIHPHVAECKAAGLGVWIGLGLDGAWKDPKVGSRVIIEALKNEPTSGQVSLDDERTNKWECAAGRAIASEIGDEVFDAFGLPAAA